MKALQPVHEVASVYVPSQKTEVLTSSTADKSLVKSVVSAFLFILIAGFVLSLFQPKPQPVEVTIPDPGFMDEEVAYQPGSFVTSQVRQGYIGR